MLGAIKRYILNVNLKKCLRLIQHPIIDLKMELLVKVANNFKLKNLFEKRFILDVSQILSSLLTTIIKRFLRTTKEVYHGFLKRWLLLPSRDFTYSKSTIETLKTLEQYVKCVSS